MKKKILEQINLLELSRANLEPLQKDEFFRGRKSVIDTELEFLYSLVHTDTIPVPSAN